VIARELGRQGARVTRLWRDANALERARWSCSRTTSRHLSLRRIFQSDWMRSAVDNVVARYGRLDVVHAAFATQTRLAPFVGRARNPHCRIIDAATRARRQHPTIQHVGTIYAPQVGGSLT
jgi:hypothetical protein